MKKLIVFLALLLPVLQEHALAQELEGTWSFHPSYLMSTANNLIDTEPKTKTDIESIEKYLNL